MHAEAPAPSERCTRNVSLPPNPMKAQFGKTAFDTGRRAVSCGFAMTWRRGFAHRRLSPRHTARLFLFIWRIEMLSCIPRSDPGAVITHLRPNGYGVSAPAGKLPHGRLPRLVLLGLYAEVLRTGEHSVDLGYAFCDYLHALGLREAFELPEQAERLFRCTLRFDGWTSRMTWLSMLGWDNAYDERWRGIIPQRNTQVAFTAPVAKAMLRHPVRLCMHSLRALQHSAFALDVYLWDAWHRVGAEPRAGPGGRLPGARRAPRATPGPRRARGLRTRPFPGARADCASCGRGSQGAGGAGVRAAARGLAAPGRIATRRRTGVGAGHKAPGAASPGAGGQRAIPAASAAGALRLPAGSGSVRRAVARVPPPGGCAPPSASQRRPLPRHAPYPRSILASDRTPPFRADCGMPVRACPMAPRPRPSSAVCHPGRHPCTLSPLEALRR